MAKDNLSNRAKSSQQRVGRLLSDSDKRRELEKVLPGAIDDLQRLLDEVQIAETQVQRLDDELSGVRPAAKGQHRNYRELFDLAPQAYLVTEPDGRIREANQAAQVLLRKDRKDLVGSPLSTIVREGDRQRLEESVSALHDSGRIEDWDFVLVPREGEPFPGNFCVNVARDGDGQPESLRMLIRTSSERTPGSVALGQSEEKWRSLVSTAPDIIVILDPDGTIRYLNRTVTRLTVDQVTGTSAFDYMPPEERQPMKELIEKVLRTGEFASYELESAGPNGTRAWYSARMGPFWRDGKIVGITAIVTDVSERKRAEEELKRAHEELEGRVKERTADLEDADRQLRSEITGREQIEGTLAWELDVNRTLAELASVLITAPSIDEISALVLEQAKRLTGSAHGYVGYIHPKTGFLVKPTLTRDVWEVCKVDDKDITFKEFRGLSGWVSKNHEPLLTNRPGEDPRSSGTPPGHIPIDKFLSAPAMLGGVLVGQVALANPGRDYTPRDLTLVTRMATLYAIAVQRKQTEEALQAAHDELEGRVEQRTADLEVANRRLEEEIAQRRGVERSRAATIELLDVVNSAEGTRELMQKLTQFFKRFTGWEAVAVRLRDRGDFPYYETTGFPEQFVLKENKLCAVDQAGELIRDSVGNAVMECMCGNIICGRVDPSKHFFTEHGSFWTNSTTELQASASASEADGQACTRDRCNGEGYESVALVPLRVGKETFGLFQFNDKRRGCFTRDSIAWLETLVDYVAIGLARHRAVEALEQSEEKQRTLLENLPQRIFYKDRNSVYVSCNQAYACDLRIEPNDIAGKTDYEFYTKELADKYREADARIMEAGETEDFEEESVKHGRTMTVQTVKTPVRDDEGDVTGILGIYWDITDRKQAEERLQFIEYAVDHNADATYWIRSDGRICYVNIAACRILEYSHDELVSMTAPQIDPDFPEEAWADHFQKLKGARTVTFEAHHRTKAGRVFPVEILSNYLEFNGQEYIWAYVRDITERKRAEEALRRSQHIVSSSTDMLALLDENYVYLAANEVYLNAHDKSHDELIGHTAAEVLGQEVFDTIIRPNAERCLAGEDVRYEEWFDFPVSGRQYMDLAYSPYTDAAGQIKGFVVCARNATDRKRAEEERERYVHDLAERVKEVTCIYGVAKAAREHESLEDVFQDVATLIPPGWQYPGITRGRIRFDGKDFVSEPFDDSRWFQTSDLLVNGERGGSVEVFYLEERPELDEGPFLKEERSLIDGIADALSEAIERKQSEERFRAIANYTYDWENWIGADGTILWINPAVERVTGYTVEECFNMPAYPVPLIHEDDRQAVVKVFEDTAILHTSGNDLPFRIRRKDGVIRWCAVSWQPLFDSEGVCLGHRSSIRDITERVEAEELARRQQDELAHVTRLNTVGEMASGIAHEINQPLCAIVNYTSGCLRRLRAEGEHSEEVLDAMEQVAVQAHRAGEIIRRVADFVRKGEPRRSTADINGIVEETIHLVQADIRSHSVTLCVELGEGISPVLADAIQIQQVLLNLIRNAIDAMVGCEGEMRVLTITTSQRCDECITVTVDDTGHGLSKAMIHKIFDPFFTTKASGLGMGLSISRSIIEAHGGRLSVSPNGDTGTTFVFTIPTEAE